MRALVVIATGVLCSMLLQTAPAPPASASTTRSTPVERMLTQISTAVDAGTPGMIARLRTQQEPAALATGVAAVDTHRPPKAHGRFRVGSVSKTFTATLVLQLADEGKLALDDPIQRYLPGLLPYEEAITIRQLLQHTSGLPNTLPLDETWASMPELDTERYVHFTPAEVVRKTTTQPLQFTPGTDWAYSNTGYTVLGMLVEDITGHPYEHALHRRILAPLRLDDTQFVRDFPYLANPAARGYEQLYPRPQPLTDVTSYNLSRFFGAGTIISTGSELNRFFEALLTGHLLSPRMLAAMQTTVPATETFDYGLGIKRVSLDPYCASEAPVVWGHDGSVPGYRTWSMHSTTAHIQVTSIGNRSITATATARAAHRLTMASAFCAPDTSAVLLAQNQRLSTPLPG